MIEVTSEKTITYECTTKLAPYEKADVPDYWIIDHKLNRLERPSLAAHGCYPLPAIFSPGVEVASMTIDGLSVAVDDVFAAVIVW